MQDLCRDPAVILLNQWAYSLRITVASSTERSILMLCGVETAGTGSVLVLFQPAWVSAAHCLWWSCGCMNGFLQWLYRTSFFSPSSEADIRGGSPGSRQVKCFSVPLVGMDVSGAVLMCVKYKHTAVSNDPR